jgi:hypothetical protein
MAGLAVCVSDLPEMARLVSQYGIGVMFDTVDSASIAGAINALDRAAIDNHKRASTAAARELCWECESKSLVAAYRTALGWPPDPVTDPVDVDVTAAAASVVAEC